MKSELEREDQTAFTSIYEAFQRDGAWRTVFFAAALLLPAVGCNSAPTPLPHTAPNGGTSGASPSGGASGATNPTSSADPGRKDIHRLNSTEYNATVRDVLRTTLEPAGGNWRGGELGGFDNVASVLGVDEAQYERYFEAAQTLAAEVMANDAQRARFVPCALAETACVQSSIEAAGLRLLRRPLETAELDTYRRVYDTARELGDDEYAAFTLILRAFLSSAEFLYRIELDPRPDSTEPHPVGPFELASRLSYFLWSSAPDEELLRAAADGSLTWPSAPGAVVDRMLDDPRSERFVENFAGQWLGARHVLSHPTSPRFYQWTKAVALAAGREMILYFSDFLRSGRSFFEFPRADINYADGSLALFYGIPTDLRDSGPLQRFEFHDDRRAGFFGLAGFLALSSFDRRTSPSKRGYWIATTILCIEPLSPPPGVPELDGEGDDDTSTLNVRERLARHREDPACAGCHELFDPYGLALEDYDAVGLYRSTYEDGTPVDTTTTLPPSDAFPSGLPVGGLEELSEAISNDPRLARCLAEKLFTYGLGRLLTPGDEPHLQRAREEWLAPGQTPNIRRLIHAMVSTDAFRFRRGGP